MDLPSRHDELFSAENTLSFDFFSLQLSEGFVPEGIPPLAPQFEVAFGCREDEAFVLAFRSRVKESFCHMSAKFHLRSA